jgi:hypothetical protein
MVIEPEGFNTATAKARRRTWKIDNEAEVQYKDEY